MHHVKYATTDVLLSTTRPNLNSVAMVPKELDGHVCSTGFCVLRANHECDPHFLFFYTQSPHLVKALTDLTQGALYPAVTNRQVYSLLVNFPPLEKQQRIATQLKSQLAILMQVKFCIKFLQNPDSLRILEYGRH